MDDRGDQHLRNRIRSGIERDVKACTDLVHICISDMNSSVLKLQQLPNVDLPKETETFADIEQEMQNKYKIKIQELKDMLSESFLNKKHTNRPSC